MIHSEGLVFRYFTRDEDNTEEVTAIDGLTIEIEKGSFVAVLGRNGSGKSTFAKHINALLSPTEGTILIGGLDSRDEDNIWEIRRMAGMVFQNPDNQIVSSIIEEDVAFGPENLGVPPEEIKKRVASSLESVGMGAHKGSSPQYLSGGQKQRVAIAGILAMKPDCIVLDEPTSMLDPIGRKEVLETAVRLNREEGITIVLITHFMEEAVLADRVVVMDGGKAVLDGSPSKVFANVERIQALGLDVPQVTECAHLLRGMGLPLAPDILTIKDLVNNLCELN